MKAAVTALVLLAAVGLGGCGLNVQSPDVFLIERIETAPAHPTQTLLINNAGFARCNGGKQKTISSAQLIAARDLSDNLASAATKNLSIKPAPGTVYRYVIQMQQGTIRFPDVAGRSHRHLAQAELYFVQAMQGICHISV